MENQNNSSLRRNCHTILRQFRHTLDLRKAVIALVVLLLMIVQLVRYQAKPRSQSLDETGLAATLNPASVRLSNPSMVQFMQEKEEEFIKRKQLADQICQSLTPESPLYKPRNGTINFDILWDHHYQVTFSNL